MRRQEVFDVLSGERAYQQKKWGPKGTARANGGEPGQTELHDLGDGSPAVSHDVGNWIVFMETYLLIAKNALTMQDGHTAALDQLRKVVGLGVACFEQHGCPRRAEH